MGNRYGAVGAQVRFLEKDGPPELIAIAGFIEFKQELLLFRSRSSRAQVVDLENGLLVNAVNGLTAASLFILGSEGD